jgi:hypothetical protein
MVYILLPSVLHIALSLMLVCYTCIFKQTEFNNACLHYMFIIIIIINHMHECAFLTYAINFQNYRWKVLHKSVHIPDQYAGILLDSHTENCCHLVMYNRMHKDSPHSQHSPAQQCTLGSHCWV